MVVEIPLYCLGWIAKASFKLQSLGNFLECITLDDVSNLVF